MDDARAKTILILALSVFVAATRFLAASHSMWEWDEAQFASATREYNVTVHHPHPPGFPLFLAAAKLARVFIGDDFRALRAVSLAASMFVFPLFFAFARALRFPFATSVAAALIFSFLPNVWFWGGTAFSDVLALALFLASAALLFREDTSTRSYLGGSILYAATLLVRPPNLLLVWPWVVASWRRFRARRIGVVATSAMLVSVLVIGGYAIAAAASTGWNDFIRVTRVHQKYVASVDGWPNPARPPVLDVVDDFAIDPFGANALSNVLFAFVVISLLRPRRRHFHVLATFLPTLVLACFYLSVTGMSRLSLSYMSMHALFAADGIATLAALISRAAQGEQARNRIALSAQAVIASAIVAGYIVWIWPALRETRLTDAPSAAAAKWIRDRVPRETGHIYLHGSMVAFARYYLDGYRLEPVPDDVDPSRLPEEKNAYYIAESAISTPETIVFRRSRERLAELSHRRGFVSVVVPTGQTTVFLEGWHPLEWAPGDTTWRWMSGRSRVRLETAAAEVELEMKLYAPIDTVPSQTIAISFNGRRIDQFNPKKADFTVRYRLKTAGSGEDDLVIEVDQVVNLAKLGRSDDGRDLGLRLNEIKWRPVNQR